MKCCVYMICNLTAYKTYMVGVYGMLCVYDLCNLNAYKTYMVGV
jgi:hypothetical protein